jgi:hypothetical protein
MRATTYVCLFDLRPYDGRVAPALRLYARQYDPKAVVALLRDVIRLLPGLRQEPRRILLGDEDYQHWIVSLEPDAGHKPSEETMRELADMLIPPLCIPHGLGLNPMQATDMLAPWLTERSEWFADLEKGGEELAGGRLEFTFGSGSRIATRQQIGQFLDEIRGIAPPGGTPDSLSRDFDNLRKLLEKANSEPAFTLLRTAV